MTLLDLRDTDTDARFDLIVEPPAPAPSNRAFWIRLAGVVGLTAVAYAPAYAGVVAETTSGSRTAFLVVVPVLLVLIATGYRTRPQGVDDGESDWILAMLVGCASFIAIHLVGQRLPTLASLWQLPLLGAVVFFACLLAVMFGVRHVARMWPLWLFALCCVTPLPFLLVTAVAGGSDTAAVLLATALGSVAVVLAARPARARSRMLAGLGCFVSAAPIGVVASEMAGLLFATVLAAGVAPVLAIALFASVRSQTGHAAPLEVPFDLPRRSPLSMAFLALVAVSLMVLNPSATVRPAMSTGAIDWIERSALQSPTNYDFITRFLGADSRLDRYVVPAVEGLPTAAVDVITTKNPAVLDDFADALWYPSARPVDYRAAQESDSMPLGARVIHSNADAATVGLDAHWYAVTWVWNVGSVFQRVTVIVSQSFDKNQLPPQPQPLSITAHAVRPAIWLARQQPVSTGQVDDLVVRRASDVVSGITAAAFHRDVAPTDA